jgi:S1-C subfamily serine protease
MDNSTAKRGLVVAGIAGAATAVIIGVSAATGSGPLALDSLISNVTAVAGSGQEAVVGTGYFPGFGGSTSNSGSDSSGGTDSGSGSSTGIGSSSTGPTGSTTTVGTSGTATDEQEVGLVYIYTVLDYDQGEAAGTGLILTSDGEILTNNHVVEDSTSVKVVVVSTGVTYTASVVGTSPTNDIAVLQLDGATGLRIADLGDSSSVVVGAAVTGVGNAGGDGGDAHAATGAVTALGQSITATDEGGANAENLTGLIQTSAPIEAGDSGGALYDANGEVIGIDTAASVSGRSGATTTSFAIPINHALEIAAAIESGQGSDTIHIGYPAFLGVQIGSSARYGSQQSAATIAGVVSGSPAAQAGITAGSTITAIGSTPISAATDVSAALNGYDAGDTVNVSWTDSSGQSHSASVTLAQGPAD